MKLMTISTTLKGTGIAIVFVAWLFADDVQAKFYLMCGAYVFTSTAWYIAAQVAKQRLEILRRLKAAIERQRMYVGPVASDDLF